MESSTEVCFSAAAGYVTQVTAHTCEGNSIVYQPFVDIGNAICLQAIQNISHLLSSPHMKHVLVVVPTEYMVRYLTQFLKRHLHTSSVKAWFGHGEPPDPIFDSIAEYLWSKIIVTMPSALQSLFSSGLQRSQLVLIIVYDCTSFTQDGSLNEVLKPIEDIEEQPRILCFASSLVKDCLCEEDFASALLDLQSFYHSSIATVHGHYSLARVMPLTVDTFCTYKHYKVMGKPCNDVLLELKDLVEKCSSFDFQFNEKVCHSVGETSTTHFNIPDILLDVKYYLEELGEYGASVATLLVLRNLISLNDFGDSSIDNQMTKHMLNYLICCVSKFRNILEDDMFRVQKCERIERFSSDKIQSLLKMLKKLEKGERAVIIMTKPHSACILTTILQNAAKLNKDLTHLKSELILNGSGIPKSDAWHDVLSWNRNMDVYARFVALKTNVIILSGELQGLDLPGSDVAYVMEMVDQFSQFISLKKILKPECGELVMFCNESYSLQYQEKIRSFQGIEMKMREALVTACQCDSGKVDPENETPSYTTGNGKVLNLKNAVSIINKFCSKLPTDMFTSHQPFWVKQDYPNSSGGVGISVNLYLPRILPNNIIKGDKALSLKSAKKLAAFQACKELHLRKELNDNLDHQSESDAHLDIEPGFAPSEKNTNGEEFACNIVHPEAFSGAQPLPGVKSYIHKIRMYPVSQPPLPGDNRKTALYELLCDRSSFAIVSSKPLPKVCSFPVFIYGHEVTVEVNTVKSEVLFTEKEFSLLRTFHCGLFLNIVPLVQCFVQFDILNKDNSFLVAPLTPDEKLDWDTIKNHSSIPNVKDLTPAERADLNCTKETHEHKMVAPWYRHLSSHQIYLVASVCEDMSADSCFPTDEYDSFTEYYFARYKIELMRPELPMLEVCSVNTKFNALCPRLNSRKLRREEKMEDFREHMVPELCQLISFPSSLWLKLASLPSVLHRLSRLLVMDDMRRQICLEKGVGDLDPEWPPFCTEHFSCIEDLAPAKIAPSAVKRGLVIGNVKLEERKRQARSKKPWGPIQEPMDIDRHLETLNELEIHYFGAFIVKDQSASHQVSSEAACKDFEPGTTEDMLDTECMHSANDKNGIHINLLNINRSGSGPRLHEFLEAFTSSYSEDVVNMDRISVLGNTFITFVVSIYLYVMNPTTLASKLYQQQKEFLSRDRLALYAQEKNLCGRIKVLEFSPGDWSPPGFTTPHMLKDVLINEEIDPGVLPKVNLTEEEQISGIIRDDSQDEILEILTEHTARGICKREEAFIGRQYVTVETASKCIESLIGIYFRACGWDGALKITDWLGLFPSGSIQHLLNFEDPYATSHVPLSVSHRLAFLEQILNYEFHDKHLLVGSMTHCSYADTAVSGCMDRLVFLGKAVLDILLTTYIFEKCDSLTPSKLVNLREALLRCSTLAALAVQHGLHKYLLMSSSSLLSAVDHFVRHLEENQNEITDEVSLLIEEHECDDVHKVELPAVLGNLLPSLVGAVYLDAGKNLLLVWNVIQKIFIPQINEWKDNVPLSVIALLMDLSPAAHQVLFSTPVIDPCGRTEICCTLLVDNGREEIFHASGPDKIKAQTLAAKLALRALLGSPEATIEL